MDVMREVNSGDLVHVHEPDGSVALKIVVNVISPTEVQVADLDKNRPLFDASTAPILVRGAQPGQWEATEEPPSEGNQRMREGLQIATHPVIHVLHSLLSVNLPSDIEEVFVMIRRIYADKDSRSPFYEVQHRSEPFNNADHFYNLFTMGVQEGLRSSLYFLERFSSLTEMIRAQGASIVSDVKPSQSGTLGINPGVLNAEYEAFMLLSRATLDRLNAAFKYYFQPKRSKQISNLYQLQDELTKNYSGSKYAESIVQVIIRHKPYLDTQFAGQGQPTERNRLAHQEFIGFATPNIIYTSDGEIRVDLVYEDDLQPNADATKELIDRFNKLRFFIMDILKAFFTV
jgi:hypothetical protein